MILPAVRSLRPSVLVTLLSLCASWAFAWPVAVAAHLLADDHHEHEPGAEATGLAVALHGHAHDDDVPDHGHPFVGSVAGPVPGQDVLSLPAMVGLEPETPAAFLRGRGPWARPREAPSHDPPPRLEAEILRI